MATEVDDTDHPQDAGLHHGTVDAALDLLIAREAIRDLTAGQDRGHSRAGQEAVRRHGGVTEVVEVEEEATGEEHPVHHAGEVGEEARAIRAIAASAGAAVEVGEVTAGGDGTSIQGHIRLGCREAMMASLLDTALSSLRHGLVKKHRVWRGPLCTPLSVVDWVC